MGTAGPNALDGDEVYYVDLAPDDANIHCVVAPLGQRTLRDVPRA